MGRNSVLMVFSLSVMLGVVLPNIFSLGDRSTENFLDYANTAQTHNIAVSGANVAANQIFLNHAWRAGYSDVALSGGTYNVTAADYGANQVKITSIARYEDMKDTVTVLMQPSSFASYAYYSKVEGSITWVTGDTIWGPFHTQAIMKIIGTPVFQGRVSAMGGTNPKNNGARFHGGYFVGENIDLPADLSPVVNAANAGGKVYSSGDLWLTFNGTSVNWKTSAYGTINTTLLSTFAPNGAILVSEGNLHIKGTLDGKLTLCATGPAGLTAGNIYIDDDMKYAVDPRVATSDDMLGLVCDNSVIITDNTPNDHSIVLNASILCRTGGLTAENYSSRGVAGTLNLLGGVIQYQRGPVGTFSGSGGSVTITSGFKKDYRYDTRFNLESPPFFPLTGGFQIVYWRE